MDSIVISWRELLLAVIVVLAIYVAEVLLLLRVGNLRGLRLWRRGAKAHADHLVLQSLQEEVASLRQQIGMLRAEMDRLGTVTRPPGDPPTPYVRAIDLAKDGRPSPEVAADCGISRGEAELIVALYGRR